MIDTDELLALQKAVDSVFVHQHIAEYVVRLVYATRDPAAFEVDGVQGLHRVRREPAREPRARRRRACARAAPRPRLRAAQDVTDLAPDVLRHRLVLTFDAVADGVTVETVLDRLLAAIPPPDITPAQSRFPSSAVPVGRSRTHRTRADGRMTRDYLQANRRLQQLELDVVRRLDGLLQGDYRGLVAGAGTEPAESRLYNVGDDLRRMDWRLTARTTQPYVRDTIADRELELWVVVDDSPSLRFGTARYLKWDLALGAVASVSLLTARAGNRVGCGAVRWGAGCVCSRRRSGGKRPCSSSRTSTARRASAAPKVQPSSLADALQATARLARRRGMVVVVSDFLFGTEWESAMRSLRDKHDVLAFELIDPRELELPPVGMLTLVDPETGRSRHVQSSSPRVRKRYAALAAEQRAAIRASLRAAGADHVALRTDTDWVLDIARFVARRRRLTRHGARQWSAVS